jgi:hypothetical protein
MINIFTGHTFYTRLHLHGFNIISYYYNLLFNIIKAYFILNNY